MGCRAQNSGGGGARCFPGSTVPIVQRIARRSLPSFPLGASVIPRQARRSHQLATLAAARLQPARDSHDLDDWIFGGRGDRNGPARGRELRAFRTIGDQEDPRACQTNPAAGYAVERTRGLYYAAKA